MTDSVDHDPEKEGSCTEDSEEGQFQLSDKGKRMAATIAEYLLMRYFFPDLRKDRKKMNVVKTAFMTDM